MKTSWTSSGGTVRSPLATSILVVALSVVALVAGGLARGAPAVQGVHGGGMKTAFGFTDQFSISVTRQASGNVAGHIRVGGSITMIQASPTGLSIFGDEACITGRVTRTAGSEPLGSIALLIRDVPDGRDLIVFSVGAGPPGEPPFDCAPLARALTFEPPPELVTGNFTFIGN